MFNPPDDDTNNMDTGQPNINLSETETHTPSPIFIKSSTLNYNGFYILAQMIICMQK